MTNAFSKSQNYKCMPRIFTLNKPIGSLCWAMCFSRPTGPQLNRKLHACQVWDERGKRILPTSTLLYQLLVARSSSGEIKQCRLPPGDPTVWVNANPKVSDSILSVRCLQEHPISLCSKSQCQREEPSTVGEAWRKFYSRGNWAAIKARRAWNGEKCQRYGVKSHRRHLPRRKKNELFCNELF